MRSKLLNVLQSQIQCHQRKYLNVEFEAKKLLVRQIQSEKEILNVLLKALVLFSLNFKCLNNTVLIEVEIAGKGGGKPWNSIQIKNKNCGIFVESHREGEVGDILDYALKNLQCNTFV